MTVLAPTLSSLVAGDGTITVSLVPAVGGDFDHVQVLYRLRGAAAWNNGPTYFGAQGEAGEVDIEGLENGQVYEVILCSLDAGGALSLPSVSLRASPTDGEGTLKLRIVKDIQAALEGISQVDGYWDDVEGVYLAEEPADLREVATPFAVVSVEPAHGDLSALLGSGSITTKRVRAVVTMVSRRTSEDLDESTWVIQESEAMAAAVQMALLEDPQRSSLAVDTEIKDEVGGPSGEQELSGAVARVTLEVQYRHQHDNPNVKRP